MHYEALSVDTHCAEERLVGPALGDANTTWHATFVFHTSDPNVLESIKSHAGRLRSGAPNTMIKFALRVPEGQTLRDIVVQTASSITQTADLPGIDVELFCWERPDLGHVAYNLRLIADAI